MPRRATLWFHSRHVERLFRADVLRMLLGKELITEAIVDNLLSWRHTRLQEVYNPRLRRRKWSGRPALNSRPAEPHSVA